MAASEIASPSQAAPETASDSEALQVVATKQEAAGRAESIRQGMGDLAGLMKTAMDRSDHIALGYASWAEYIEGEFSDALLPARRELVALMSAEGLSERQMS